MRVTKLTIKNYRSFDPSGATILFPTQHCALVGKNNAGKTNILKALNIFLGSKNPKYLKFESEDFFDPASPLEFVINISDFSAADHSSLYRLPGLTKLQQAALSRHLGKNTADIEISLKRGAYLQSMAEDSEETEDDIFELKLWGFAVHRKIEDVRHFLLKMLMVPAIRDYTDELSASHWTHYGQLMKEVLESSPNYAAVKSALQDLNSKIQLIFASQKSALLSSANIVSYVDDIDFQITRNNEPAELLRNLEVFVKENGKLFNIADMGTGTQNAIIIGILELALKSKFAHCKFFGIEEPEAFIHPHGIRYLGSLIKNISSEASTQILVSTHSLSLVSHFEPVEIIKVDKVNGASVIHQNTQLASTHFKKFINQDNAEIFFSDCVLLVEGATEKNLFYGLDKYTKQDPSNPSSQDCNFDRVNLGVIQMNSKDNITNYLKIVNSFNIPYAAILDKDFLPSSVCRSLFTHWGFTYDLTNTTQMINDLKTKSIFVIPQGEIEDLFSNTDLVSISGKTLAQITSIKSAYPNKTSDAFKSIFAMGKAEYAMLIADYYVNNSVGSPLDDLIRKIYNRDFSNIVF